MAKKSINIRAGFDMKSFSTSSQNLTRSLQGTAKKMKSIGQSMSMSLTLPIVGLGAIATKTFSDFQQSMAKVQAISGATGKDFEALTQTAKDLGISTRFAASEVSDLMLNYSKLGFSSDEIQKITGATLDLALATGEDLASSAETAGATLRGFGLEANEMQRVVDVMAKSFSSSALNLEKFSTSMATLAPVAKNAGVSLEQATGYISILVDRGIDASTAGTGLRNIFLDLASSGMTLDQAMNQIANSTNKNKTAYDLFGKRGATVAAIMAENADEANSLAKSYENSAGSAKAMADIMDDTLEGSMMKLKSATEGLAISFGEVMAPAVGMAADFLSSIAMKFSNLSEGTKQTIVIIGALVAAIGPLVFVIGSVMAVMTPLNLTIAGIVLVLAGLAAVVVYVVRNWEALTERFSDVGWWRNTIIDMSAFFIRYNPISLFIKGVNFLIDFWQNTEWFKKGLLMMGQAFLNFNPIDLLIKSINKVASYMGKELIKPVVGVQKEIEKTGAIPNPFESMARGLEGLKVETKQYTKEVETLEQAFDGVKNKVSQLTSPGASTGGGGGSAQGPSDKQKSSLLKLKKEIYAIKAGINEINKDTPIEPVVNMDGLKEQMETIKPEAVHVFEQLGKDMGAALSSGLKDLATEGLTQLGSFLGDSLTANTMMNDQLKQTEEHYNKMIQAAQGNADEIARIEKEKAQKVAEIQESFEFDNRAKDFGRGLLDSIGKFMGQFGEAMIAMGVAQVMLNTAIASMNPALAIVGGVALIAAGAAISNLSKKGIGSPTAAGDSPMPRGGMNDFGSQAGEMGYSNMTTTRISGRDLILVQERERSFVR